MKMINVYIFLIAASNIRPKVTAEITITLETSQEAKRGDIEEISVSASFQHWFALERQLLPTIPIRPNRISQMLHSRASKTTMKIPSVR